MVKLRENFKRDIITNINNFRDQNGTEKQSGSSP